MTIQSISSIKLNNRNFKCNQCVKVETTPKTEDNNFAYSKKDIKSLANNYNIEDYSLYFYDFDIEKKDKASSINVKNKTVLGHIKDNDIELKIKPALFKDTDIYTGFINDTPVQFECDTHKKGWNDYTLEYKNAENIDKELLDMLSIQKDKRIDDLLFVTANVKI